MSKEISKQEKGRDAGRCPLQIVKCPPLVPPLEHETKREPDCKIRLI